MGRPRTTPKNSKAISAKLPPSLQIGVHQLILDRWRKTGRKASQSELLIEALEEYLTKRGVNVSQIEQDVGKWAPKEEQVSKIAKFPRKHKST
jgi:hypothetical protein